MNKTWWLVGGASLTACLLGGCLQQESGNEEEEVLTAEQAIDGYELGVAPAAAALGTSVSVDYTAPPGHSTVDWVGLFPVGGANYEYLDWVWVPPAATGTVTITLPSSATVGQFYEFRYFPNNTYQLKATSSSFEAVAPSSNYALSNEPSYPAPGSNVAISWSAPANHSTVDWVALYPAGASLSGYVTWAYVGSPGGTTGSSTMQLPASALPGDQYEFRYNLNNGYQVAASSQVFTTGNTLTAPAGPIAAGASASTTWVAPASHSAVDWIGLFEVGAPNYEIESYAFVGNGGIPSATTALTMPASAPDGQLYEFRYFINNTYTLAGRSPSFAAGEAYSLTGPPGPVAQGTTVDGVWTAPSFHSATDWIGLYQLGGSPSDIESFTFVGSSGLTSGSTAVLVPASTPPGTYELRYSINNTYTVVASSAAFEVGCGAGTGDCDGNAANGCEANTDTDPLNCGGCTSDCSVGSCVAGSCSVAELLVTGIPTVAGIASDGVELFFTSGGHAPLYMDGSLLKMPIAGGTTTTLVSGLPTMEAVALDGGQVVFTSDGSPSNFDDGLVARVSKSGGGIDVFAPNQPYAVDVVVQSGSYFWVTAGTPAGSFLDGAVRSSAAGAAPVTIASEASAEGIFVDGGYVYWTGGQTNGVLRRQPIAGGPAETLATGLSQVGSLIVVGGLVYLSTDDQVSVVDPAVPGVVTAFATDTGNPGRFAADSSNLYWTEPAGRVLRKSLAGGPTITLADNISQPFAITLNGAHIYFTVRGTGADDGGVMRILR